jgi:peptidoglycan hydrolase-like protein with peptidoglycan-binding domain
MRISIVYLAAVLLSAGITALTAPAAEARASRTDAGPAPSAARMTGAPIREMPPGRREAYVRGLQEELAAHGYRTGRVDGKLGPQTRSAVSRYQRDAGLTVNGEATDTLLDHLKFAQPKVMARRGRGASRLVADIQRELKDHGYRPGPADGMMGRRTRHAIKQYQADAKLVATGKADTQLLRHLKDGN